MPKQISIAKITRPRLQKVLPRKRLFDLLDKGLLTPVTWVTSPAGSGKTTLIASWLDAKKLPCLWYQVDQGDADIASFFYYMGLATQKAAPRYRKPLPFLTPEYLLGILTFTRNYFENLYVRLKPRITPHPPLSKGDRGGFVIVFDNYQEAPEQSQLHAVVNNALSLIPEEIKVFVLSRREPPPAFTRLRANGSMMLVGWNELRFTLQETKQIIELKGNWEPTHHAVEELHAKTEGWAAVLVLLLEQARQGAVGPELAGRFSELSQGAVFDYFAGEIFEKLESETRDFLLMTSFLPTMSVKTAEKMTDQNNAGRILSILNRNNFFTAEHPTSEPTYQYHPLFRDYLMTQMKASVNPDRLLSVQRRAAAVLEESGQIEDAIELYLQTLDWNSAIRMILGHAQTMLIQGRNKTLKEWLINIPQEIRESNPWLLYWSGMCRMGYDLAGARIELEKAFKRFMDMNDHLGMALSWSLIILVIQTEFNNFFPLDEWIAIYFENIEKVIPALPIAVQARAMSSIGMALFLRKPDSPQTASYIENSLSLAGQCKDADTALQALMVAIVYYTWVGNASRCNALVEQLRISSFSPLLSNPYLLMSRMIQSAQHLWDVSSLEESDRTISEALEFGARTGIHLWDAFFCAIGACSSLMRGDMGKAEHYLEKMKPALTPPQKEQNVQYHLMMSWRQFLKGNFSAALINVETALMLEEETGYYFVRITVLHEMAQVLHALNDDRAEEYLSQGLDLAVLSKSSILEFGCRIAKAIFVFDNGNEKTGIGLLREALSLGKKHGHYSLLYWWDPVAMSRLSVKALEYGIETDYVKDLIRIRKLVPEEPPILIESWPWPLKIFTLGEFRIEKNGKPLVFAGKVQKKPLDLLKFVIAAGGHDVPEDQAIDALWPDAEGDAGHKSFENTVARLRKLLGSDKFILLQEGKLTLDPRYCWVDAGALGRVINAADSEWGKGAPHAARALKLSEKVVSLYAGPFLAAETNRAWAVSLGEKLKSHCLRMVSRIASHWKSAGDRDKAIEYLIRGLEIDELAEDLCRELMVCYHEIGREVDAIKAYHHLREALASSLGIEPSSATEAIYRELLERKIRPQSADRSKK
jgi:LuxR family maltose regulon positive regulatory protein